MSWARVEYEALNHNKTGILAKKLKARKRQRLDRYAALGLSTAVWGWFCKFATHGNFNEIDTDELMYQIGWTEGEDALREDLLSSGYLDPNGMLHDWLEHNGESLAKRELQKTHAKQLTRYRVAKTAGYTGTFDEFVQQASSTVQSNKVVQQEAQQASELLLPLLLPTSGLSVKRGVQEGVLTYQAVDAGALVNTSKVKTPSSSSKNGKSSHVKFDHVLSQEEYEKIRSETIPVYVEMLRDYQSGNWSDDLDLSEEWKRRRNKCLNSLGCPTVRFVEAIRKYDDKEEWQYMAFDEATDPSKAVVRS